MSGSRWASARRAARVIKQTQACGWRGLENVLGHRGHWHEAPRGWRWRLRRRGVPERSLARAEALHAAASMGFEAPAIAQRGPKRPRALKSSVRQACWPARPGACTDYPGQPRLGVG